MKVNVKSVSFKQSIIEVTTKSGMKELVIDKTSTGHSYEDFVEWDISDKQFYDLEELVDSVIDRMSGSSSLDVTWS